MTSKIFKPKIVKAEQTRLSGHISVNSEEKWSVIRKKSRKMSKSIGIKNRIPSEINQAAVKTGPSPSRTCSIITPSEIRTSKMKIEKVIIINKTKKQTSFTGVMSVGTPFVLMGRGDGVKIPNDKPREIEGREFREFRPERNLGRKTRTIVNH